MADYTRGGRGATLAGIATLAVAAFGLAYAGAAEPMVFLAFGAVFVSAVTCVVAYHWPERVLTAIPVLVFLAGTKFRTRDASSVLSNDVDAQIIFELGIYGLIGVALLGIVLTRKVRFTRVGWLEMLLLGFVAFAASSVLWSGSPTLTAVRSLQLLTLWGLASISVKLLGPERWARSFGMALIAGVLAFGTIALLIPEYRDDNLEDRFSWFAVHPITAGTLAGLGILYLLSVGLHAGGRRRFAGRPAWLPWVGMIPVCIVLVLTSARGPMLALAAAGGIMIAKRHLRFWQSQFVAAVASLGALAFINSEMTFGRLLRIGAASDNPLMEMMFRGQTAEQVQSITGRTDLWAALIPLIAERPLLGFGYHGARALIMEIEAWAGYAHNAFLQTAIDLGVIGTVLLWVPILVVVVARTARRTDSARSGADAYLTAAVVFLVINSLTSESFAAAPGVEILLLFFCIIANGVRVPAPEKAPVAPAPFDGRHLRAVPATPSSTAGVSPSRRRWVSSGTR